MNFTGEHLEAFLSWLGQTSLQAGIMILLILVLKIVLGSRVSVRTHYWLWLLVIVRLLLPWAPASPVGLSQLTHESLNHIRGEFVPANHPPAETVIPYLTAPGSINIYAPAPAEPTQVVAPNLWETSNPAGHAESTPALSPIHIMLLVWAAGALLLAGYVLWSSLRFWHIIRRHRLVTREGVLDLFEDCKSQMEISTIIGLVETDKVKSPALFGFIRPRLLLPRGMTEQLSRDELRYIFLHELSHLRRGDIPMGWIMSILQVLHWFNPLIWYAFYRIRTERELACDALAMSRMGEGENTTYGRTIVNMLERFSQRQLLPSMAGILEDKSQVKRRISMIAKFTKHSYGVSAAAVVLLAVLGVLTLTNASAEEKSAAPADQKAGEFLTHLVEEKFERAERMFDTQMRKAMSEKQLQEAWGQITSQAGDFVDVLGTRKEKYLNTDIIYMTCEFDKGPLDVKVVIDDTGSVSGLWFVPTPAEVLAKYKEQHAAPPAGGGGTGGSCTPASGMPGMAAGAQDNAPKVVRTLPKNYANDVSPSLRMISIAFDRKMIPGNMSITTGPWGNKYFPPAGGKARFNSSHSTCSMPVNLEPGKAYYLSVNEGQFQNFMSGDGVRAKTYAIVFATRGADGKPTPIPDELIRRAEIINKDIAAVENPRLNEIEESAGGVSILAQDDGKPAGRNSIAGGGHAVYFENGADKELIGIRIYGSRYGESRINENVVFYAWLCDEDRQPIAEYSFPYLMFRERGDEKWVTLRTEPTLLPEKFYLCVGFDPAQTKGVYVYQDDSPSGNSYIGLPGKEWRVYNKESEGDWLIRPVVREAKPQTQENLTPVEINKKDITAEDRRMAETLIAEGWQLVQQRNMAEAESKFTLAVSHDPANANAWNGLGWAQFNGGKPMNAEEAFKKAVALEPKQVAALNGLGWINKNRGDVEQAIACWLKAVKVSEYATAPIAGLAQTYMEKGDYRQAMKFYTMWLKAEPENEQAKTGLEEAKEKLRSE